MKQKTARIISLYIAVILFASLFSWPPPVSAGVSEWSAESIPDTVNYILAPSGGGNATDIRDYAIYNDNETIYAVPGDSITGNIVFKSTDAGIKWASIPAPTRADLVAVAPDNANIVVIANNSTREIYLSDDGGIKWYPLGVPQAAGQPAAAAIMDIAISAQKNNIHYIAAAGKEAGNAANLWYYEFSQISTAWQETNVLAGMSAQDEVAAIKFSPDFSADGTLVVITDSAGGGVQLQLLNLFALLWNSNAGYIGYPCTVVSLPTMTGLVSASLTLAPTYDGQVDDTRNLFIGLTITGDATAVAASGIYRFKDDDKKEILTDKQVHSVDFNGTYLIAGLYNDTTVYRIQYPLSTTSWLVRTSSYLKNPGGENRVLVAWMGSSVAAGTGGNESAFSISKDSGTTFNDISLIDTAITNARDVAVNAGGSRVIFVTDDGADTSLWFRNSGVWSRVLSLKGATDFIVRAEKQNAGIVYLAQKGGMTIYFNSGSGTGQWQVRTCALNIADIAVESTKVVYLLGVNGKVAKSVNYGQLWEKAIDTGLTSGGMLVSVSSGKLLAGSQNGYAAYSLDGNESWKAIIQPLEAGAGKIHVVPDKNFASNSIFYAASETTGKSIMKWQIGVSDEWTDIFSGSITGGVYGIAIDNDVLYALEYNASTGQSTLWRFISPIKATSTSTDWIGISTTSTTDIDDPTVRLNATPQALKASASKLWAVKTNGTNKLYSFTDSVINVTINLIKPENGFSGNVNALTGITDDVAFTWERPSIATEYELRIALDENFYSPVASIVFASSEETVFIMAGPRQTGARQVNFTPGTTYYWKIRTTKPGYSLYSASRSFTVKPVLAGGISLLSPVNGGTVASVTPAFSWQPLAGATEYEFMLSESADMASPLLITKVEGAGMKIDSNLENGKTYFWQVRSISPFTSDWSGLANFTVKLPASSPVPGDGSTVTVPVTIALPEPSSQTELIFPPAETRESVVPGYLVFSIFVLGFLTVSVIYLTLAKNPGGIFSRPTGGSGTGAIRRPKEAVKDTGTAELPPGKSGEDDAVIFAVKSFMWMNAEEKEPADPDLVKERDSLGKKLAGKIRELAGKEPLYLKHPEETANLLHIWARYASRNETGRYLTKSFRKGTDNAIRFIRCYLPQDITPEERDPADFLTRETYQAIARVIDPEKVYSALAGLFKFKPDTIEETAPIKPADRNIAFKFMRVHLQEKQ